jgi:hypothetical protein
VYTGIFSLEFSILFQSLDRQINLDVKNAMLSCKGESYFNKLYTYSHSS